MSRSGTLWTAGTPQARLEAISHSIGRDLDDVGVSLDHHRRFERIDPDRGELDDPAFPCVFRHTGMNLDRDLFEPAFRLPPVAQWRWLPEVAVISRAEAPLYASQEAALAAATAWLREEADVPSGDGSATAVERMRGRMCPVLYEVGYDTVSFWCPPPVSEATPRPVASLTGFMTAVVDSGIHLENETLLDPMPSLRAAYLIAADKKKRDRNLWALNETVASIINKAVLQLRVAETGDEEIKRDLDLIRDIMIEIEENQNINGHYVLSDNDIGGDADRRAVQYHLRLLLDAGYVEGQDRASLDNLDVGALTRLQPDEALRSMGIEKGLDINGTSILVSRLSWEGHEFLDSVRDNNVWNKTKGALSKVGGVGIDVVKEVAKAYAKEQITKYTGLEL